MDSSSEPSAPQPGELVQADVSPPQLVCHEPNLARPARDLARFVYTNNPFYAVSASLVFWGLRSSFDTSGHSFETGAFLAGLTGYILLLAVSACVLIRAGRVWDDVRTILLLVVLMLLAVSVSFDDMLAADPAIGSWYFFGGLLFAVVVSESLLRSIRLRLPAGFRVPYYLMLGLFFLYPPALTPLLNDPRDPALYWALFGFSPLAGVIFLTLVPAIRKGHRYLRNNGSPWPWPWYPWVLFGTLALGVFGRSYYLCYSFHFVGGESTVFAPYFWVPFLFAVNILLLEIAMRSHLTKARRVALVMPVALLALAATAPLAQGHDRGFLDLFVKTLGGMPLYLTLLGVVGFYGYALLRRVPYAAGALTAALLLLSVVGPETIDTTTLTDPRGLPLFAAGLLWSALAAWQVRTEHWLLATVLLIGAATMQWRETEFLIYGGAIPCNLILAAVLILGALFDDPVARFLRAVGMPMILLASGIALFGEMEGFGDPPQSLLTSYAVGLGAVALTYGYLVRNRAYYVAAGAVLAGSLLMPSRYVYGLLRERVSGLDQLAWGAAFFLVALLISLSKAGLFRHLFSRNRSGLSPPETGEETI